jgi:WD40 repeat protein
VTTNTLIKTIPTSQGGVMYLEYLGNGLLVSGGGDGTVKTWNISASSTGVLIKTITVAGAIVALKKIDNDYLVGADSGQEIYVWNMKNFTQVLSITNAHGSTISDLEPLANNTFASCESTGSFYVKVWFLLVFKNIGLTLTLGFGLPIKICLNKIKLK